MFNYPEFESVYSKAHVLRYLSSSNLSSPAASTTRGMIYTLLINLVAVCIIIAVFESNRSLKQIFQKRFQRRFVESGRIPPEPSSRMFGWLFEIMKVEEIEVLHMVGLDAYMLLRYHVLCLKLCLFITFWGLVVLLPTYGTVNSKLVHWDKYTIINVVESNDSNDRQRVWVAVLFGYIFSAYLCQLLYNEYQNFSNIRLNCLQANHNGQVNDTTDNLPQKYYTVMLERIPPDLRSAEKLYDYFTELFPDDVFHVEVALDLRELNTVINQRNQIRNNLEKAIAYYIACQKRLQIKIKDESISSNSISSLQILKKICSYTKDLLTCRRYGYSKVDAINYYTKSLIQLNEDVKEIQKKCFVISKNINSKEIQRKIKKKYDTRAAAAVEKISSVGSSMMRKVNNLGVEVLLFGSKKLSTKNNKVPERYNKLNEIDSIDDHLVTSNPIHQSPSANSITSESNKSNSNGSLDNDSETFEVNTETANDSSSIDISNYQKSKGARKLNLVTRLKSKSKALKKKIQMNSNTKNVVEQAKFVGQAGLNQTKLAGTGAIRGILEAERTLEMLLVGAYYKYSSTAFVTFTSRMAEAIAYQMLLSNDNLEITHAPNPHDILWENIAIPKSQVRIRSYITDIGLVVGSIFWSSLVTSVNKFAKSLLQVEQQQNLLSVMIILGFLLSLPAWFDLISRYYEGMKLESDIQDSIMTRYFYYQLINIYVSIGLGDLTIVKHVILMLKTPQMFVNLLGQTIPSLSLYFCDLLIVKSFIAVPGEMCRPFQLSTIFLLGKLIDRKRFTRRELRTGAFYAWPMLYGTLSYYSIITCVYILIVLGWVYPGLFLVLLIVLIFSCIAPLMMPFGILFFVLSYEMYKYQLLYVYVNNNQALGFMFYAVFNRSLIIAIFASLTLLSFFGCHQRDISVGPFIMALPLPFALLYFWHYCDSVFKKTSLDLSFGLAKKIDYRNVALKESNRPIPTDSFKKDLYRQPSLTEPPQYPEPYRKSNDSASDILLKKLTIEQKKNIISLIPDDLDIESNNRKNDDSEINREYRLRSSSINVHYVDDEVEETTEQLEKYFVDVVLNHLCTDKSCLELYSNITSTINKPNENIDIDRETNSDKIIDSLHEVSK